MRRVAAVLPVALAFGACRLAPTRSTSPIAAFSPAPSMTAPAVSLEQPPPNWHLLDQATDHIPGISAERAMNELLAGRTPKQTVLVAIIDTGIDTTNADLRPNLWTNPKEIPGNGKDDDHNGYVDDMHGWNFVGGRDGRNLEHEVLEVTRDYALCHGGGAAAGLPPTTNAAPCHEIDSAYAKQRALAEDEITQARAYQAVYKQILPLLAKAAGTESLTVERVRALNPLTPDVLGARQTYLDLSAKEWAPSDVEDDLTYQQGVLQYRLNPEYNPRSLVGDRSADLNDRDYGNNDVMGSAANHGTAMAGIIGAAERKGSEVHGIAPAVKLMMIRILPPDGGGDRDKDVANAIRYAAENGAQIISMSFGKEFSPYKSAVDDAVKYADAHGVLMVHSAGNNAADLRGKFYPSPAYLDGGRARNWIEVGNSSWKGGEHLAFQNSNYSQEQVDVFAPGLDILSTVTRNRYQRQTGTSPSTAVVSGVAALIMDFYPTLSAAEVKRIILASATRYSDQRVVRPGSKNGELVPFGTLSVTGGIVNAYNAIKLAEALTGGKVQP